MDWKDWDVACRFCQVSIPLVSLGGVHLEESTTCSLILGFGEGGGLPWNDGDCKGNAAKCTCQKIGKLGQFCTNKELKRV